MASRWLQRSRRPVFGRLRQWKSLRSLSSVEFPPELRDPSASEVLRFAMTTPAASPSEHDHNAAFRAWTLLELDPRGKGSHPGVAVWGALKGHRSVLDPVEARRLLAEIDVASLRNIIERIPVNPRGPELLPTPHTPPLIMMLRRCLVRNTNIEIISFLNDLNARLERLEGWTSPHVFELGIIFASLNLSVQALQHFIARHQRLHGDQHLETGPLIVRALSDGLSSTLFETPGYDTKPLLSVITGEEDIFSRDTARLHDKLKLPPGAQSLYLCLLARLQSNEVLYVAWGNFINDLKISERKKFRKGFHDSYSVVQALLESARPEIACRFLEDIAMRSEHDLPFIETFSGLRTLLGSPVICKTLPTLIGHEQYRSILNAYLKDMEQRLGLKWQNASRGEQEGHVGLAPGPAWSVFHDQPLFTIDGDSAGYDSPSRLFCELGARGCSKSQSDLARLVDLLHEHDGNVYDVQPTSPYFRKENHRLRSARQSFPVVNFRWRPQHSPIEFSDSPLSQLTDFSQASDPVSLGLLRARKIIRGDPETGAECLHLMQLGYLDVQHGEDQPWMPSGYLVTLDRQYGNILAFFVGPNHGVVNPGPTPTDAPFGPVFALQSKRAGPGQRLPFNHYLRDLRGHYYLDVDPSPDLDTRE